MDRVYGIVANVINDRVLRTGAKVWILYCNGDAACPVVRGLSKSGRSVRKYTHYKRLTNFRCAWIPEHMRAEVVGYSKPDATERAETLGRMWSGVRFFNRDGTKLMRDGVSEEEAFRRATMN